MFQTEWLLKATAERVFDVLARPQDYEAWWPSVTRSAPVSGGDGVGSRAAYTIRSPLLFSMDLELHVIEENRPRHIKWLVRGDLIGTGTIDIEANADSLRMVLDWHVATTRRWMGVVAVLGRPVLSWAHSRVMSQGGRALAKHLQAELLASRTTLLQQQGAKALPDRDVAAT